MSNALLAQKVWYPIRSSVVIAACLFLTLLVSLAWSPSAQAQRSDRGSQETGEAPHETEMQRWIPLDTLQSPTRNPLQYLQQLKEVNNGPSTKLPYSIDQLAQWALKNPAVTEQLKNLTPTQIEQLRHLADQFTNENLPNGLPKGIQDISPELREQIESSEAMRDLATKLAQSILEENERSLASDLESSPFQDPEKALSTNDHSTPETQQTPNPSSKKDSPERNDTATRSPNSSYDRSIRDGEPPNSDRTSESSARPATSHATPQSDAIVTPSPAATAPRQVPRVPRRNPPPPSVRNQPAPTPTSSRQRSLAGGGSFTPSFAPRPPQITEFRSNSSNGSFSNLERANKEESASQVLQRKVRELGINTFLQKIAQEAAGLERKAIAKTEEKEEKRQDKKNGGTWNRSASAPNTDQPSSNSRDPIASLPEDADENGGTAQSFAAWLFGEGAAPYDLEGPSPRGGGSKEQAGGSGLLDSNPFTSLPVWVWGILLAILCLFGLLWLIPNSPKILDGITGKSAATRAKRIASLQEIRSRQDVIAAFHWVLIEKIRGFEDWWTSKRVVQQARAQNEPLQPQLEEAAQLYELARYTPAEQPFHDRDLERVRLALQACANASSIG